MTESFLKDRVVLHPGDCLDVLARFEENSIDSCVCDPPYHLTNNTGTRSPNPGQYTPIGKPKQPKGGFMGQQWDGGDIAFRPELWAEVYRVLKPGAFLLAFSATRTYHRMACAIEDAGFEVRDMVSWLYGSGFPKSHDVSKAIDKAAGAERSKVRVDASDVRNPKATGAGRDGMEGATRPWIEAALELGYHEKDSDEPATDAAREWAGWGTALKPALEPICMARKPLIGTVAANVLAHGTGAINIDGCRVGTEELTYAPKGTSANAAMIRVPEHRIGAAGDEVTVKGRWPANVIHDGSEEVVGAFPDSGPSSDRPRNNGSFDSVAKGHEYAHTKFGHTDNGGSAARFFYQAKKDELCDLCHLPISAHTVEQNSPTTSIQNDGSVPGNAADLQPPGNGARNSQPNGPAGNAASHSPQCHQPKCASVQKSAQDLLLSKIVQNAKSAASLCSLCATDIARGLVALKTRLSEELLQFPASISGRNAQILRHHLALYVEGRENTDIILTTESLKILLGSVFHAIASTTPEKRADENEASTAEKSNRLFYSSKADFLDRIGSSHPTVKPVDLMQYLVRLVTPKGGLVLDLFAGTGTTGEAAWREGMRAVLIEREAEYQADIRRRMKLCLSGPDERAREGIKAKLADKPIDAGPLFECLT